MEQEEIIDTFGTCHSPIPKYAGPPCHTTIRPAALAVVAVSATTSPWKSMMPFGTGKGARHTTRGKGSTSACFRLISSAGYPATDKALHVTCSSSACKHSLLLHNVSSIA